MAALTPLLALALLAAPADRPARGAADVLPFRAVERTLPNGLRAIVVPTASSPGVVALHVVVGAGSRNEVDPGRSGFAHLFEHLMFRGTRAFPADRAQALLTRMGARQNAETSDDLTDYHLVFAKEDLARVLELEADRFMNLDVGADAFRIEARAVLGEYDKGASDPETRLQEAQREAAFRVHPYRHTAMGFLADVEDMPNQHEYARIFHARWYRPELATVVVAGDVVPERVLPEIERRFGGWRRGAERVEIPREPAPAGPVVAHVPWPTPTLPWVSVAIRAPAFSASSREWAATRLLLSLGFGEASEVRRRLVVEEQVVDRLVVDAPARVDPALFTVAARLRRPQDALRVRDELLRTLAAARAVPPDAARLAAEIAAERGALVRSLDSTEAVAEAVARFAPFERSSGTLQRLHRTLAAVGSDDVLRAARAFVTDAGLVVTTLSGEPLPEGMARLPPLASLAPAGEPADVPVVRVPSPLPVVTLKLLFQAGSARDPAGKEGLAALAADLLAGGGSRRLRIDAIREALHPFAVTFDARVDKELATFTGTFPRDGWERFVDVALPQLTDPGLREEDLRRVKEEHLAALVQDLRQANEEELAKEELQARLFAGTPYAHPVLGTVAGIRAVTLEDVRAFVRERYVRADAVVGVGGDAPGELLPRVRLALAALPPGAPPPATVVAGRRPEGLEVEIVEKEARGTALSLGHPIDVVRGHPDFVPLLVARTWLGEHRSVTSHLYRRIREARGLSYGAYAYLEAFPRGMFQLVPEPNVARRAQLFEIWIRPVAPRNAVMALRIALFELRRLVQDGLDPAQFEEAREYLSRNVRLLASRQDAGVGAALDARWFGTPEYAAYVADRLGRLTRDEVNAAIRRHLSAEDLSIVAVTRDAAALADALASDAPTAVAYEADQPQALLDEDRRIGGLRLGIAREAIRTIRAEELFER
jgi:zinc protease